MGEISNVSNEGMDICVEMHHGRKGKNMGTKFKGVARGILISTLIMSSILSASALAYAETTDVGVRTEAQNIVSVYGVSYQEAVNAVRTTINLVVAQKKMRTVTQEMIDKLASEIHQLEISVDKTDYSQITMVSQILDSAESAVADVQDNTSVAVAISVARQSLGIETASLNVNQAKAAVKSFDDVPSGHWAYDKVMRAVELGLFQGTRDPDANGVGHFNVDGKMTRAEFITVAIRAAGISETSYNAGHWYDGEWDAAVKWGIIKKDDFGGLDGLTQPCSRAEMAYIAVQTLAYKGEKPSRLVDTSRIADWKDINSYRDYVHKAYSMGILCGVNDIGTFNPTGTLTRAQAATVCVRLLDKDSRETPIFEPVQQEESTQALTIHEGDIHYRPLQAGDTVIKLDGTKVVLTETNVHGMKIVGLGQGVDIWSGYTNQNDGTYQIVMGVEEYGARCLYNDWDDSPLIKGRSGEVHSEEERTRILTYADELGFTKPTVNGTYDGQRMNSFWEWRTTSKFEDNFTPQWVWSM